MVYLGSGVELINAGCAGKKHFKIRERLRSGSLHCLRGSFLKSTLGVPFWKLAVLQFFIFQAFFFDSPNLFMGPFSFLERFPNCSVEVYSLFWPALPWASLCPTWVMARGIPGSLLSFGGGMAHPGHGHLEMRVCGAAGGPRWCEGGEGRAEET